MSTPDEYGFSTDLAHFAEDEKHHGAVIPPIYQNSLFVFDTMEELHTAIQNHPGSAPHHYSRVSNPTIDILEQKLAHFEGGEACKVFAAGMTGVSMAILSCVKQGSHVVAVDGIYGPTKAFLTDYLLQFGVECSIVDGRDTQAIIDACKDNTTLIYLETPTSNTFRLQDVPAICAFARSKGITTIVDSTYNTPIHMKPLEMGADIVVHSLTKYYGGHSNAMGGAVIGSKAYIQKLIKREILMIGALLPPFPAWLFIQGTRTLKLRIKQHEATANQVATWLEQQPEVKVVHHISLPSNPQYELYKATMTGSSGLFSFEAKTRDKAKIMDFCNRLKQFGRGISWGAFESLVVASHVKPIDYAESEWFVRLFCGLEDPEDLIADIAQALPALR
ncbi:MAG: PLP-dependent transferase [Armatimonadetes bacterium]|nr:PLP-dependent transferase [Armatimonadota bacterium]